MEQCHDEQVPDLLMSVMQMSRRYSNVSQTIQQGLRDNPWCNFFPLTNSWWW